MKTKSNFTQLILCMLCGISYFFSDKVQAQKKSEDRRPNIVYIMSDDHAYQAISAYDGTLNKSELNRTPNIDRIAKEGAIFTNSFVTNSLCAPSRAVMLTGKHSFMNGKVNNMSPFNWDQQSFPKLLRKAGYQTALIGKIHLDGHPQGFDYSAVLPGQGDYYNPDFIINDKKTRIPGYVTDITTDLAMKWLKDRDADRPFCLLYHQKAPHREWMPAKRHYTEYTKKTYSEPSTLFDDFGGRGTAAKIAEMNILEDQNWAGDSKLPPEVMEELGISEGTTWGIEAYRNNLGRMDAEQRASWDSIYNPIGEAFKKKYPNMSEKELMHWRYERYMQDYMGSIAAVDDGVGEVLDFLKANGLEENTIVVYTSDQGFYLGEHGWFDKRFMYEESMRTPLMIKYPKEVVPETVIDELVQNIDYASTFLDYAGVKIPKVMQGKSLRPLLKGEDPKWRDAVYYTYYQYPSIHMVKRHYGIRTNRYKLIHFYYDIDEWELYDLEKDPRELNSVYDDSAYAKVREKLHKQLKKLRNYYGDSDEMNKKFLPE